MYKMTRIAMKFYHLSEWIVRLAYVNFLWIAFTIIGLGVLGLMPATISMFVVIRKWRLGEEDTAIFSTFWNTYKKEFLKSNLYGLIFFSIGYVLSIEYQVLRNVEEISYLIASYGVLGLFLLLVVTVIYFFPVFVHFDLQKLQYFKWSFVIGIIHPLLTAVLFVGIGLLVYFTYVIIPALLFFFGGSVVAYIIMWGVSLTFSSYETTEEA